MRVECKNCGERIGQVEAMASWVPVARIWLAVIVLFIYFCCIRAVPTHHFSEFEPWLLAGSVVSFYFVFCLLAPGWATWLRYCRTRCPKCGARSWTKGMYEGWGL